MFKALGWEMAEKVKSILPKHEDLSTHQKLGLAMHPLITQAKKGGSLGFTDKQLSYKFSGRLHLNSTVRQSDKSGCKCPPLTFIDNGMWMPVHMCTDILTHTYTTFTHIHSYIFFRSQKIEALQQYPWELQQVSGVGRNPNHAEVV